MTTYLRRLFNRHNAQTTPKPGVDDIESVLSDSPLAQATERYTLAVATAQSVGLVREHNEDAFISLTSTLADKDQITNIGCFIVADGMGGHLYGEIASSTAVRVMGQFFTRNILLPSMNGKSSQAKLTWDELLNQGIQEANLAVNKEAPGGGTTLTVMVVSNDRISIGHVGDSRAYYISPQGEISALTRDHSFVQQLVEMGKLSPEEAEIHPQRNVLYLAVGQFEALEPEITSRPLPRNGHLLVCSDGLWGVISEKTIVDIVNNNTSLDAACQELIEAANNAGGPDNITAILVRISPE
jgi:PPM family protein phosphatase